MAMGFSNPYRYPVEAWLLEPAATQDGQTQPLPLDRVLRVFRMQLSGTTGLERQYVIRRMRKKLAQNSPEVVTRILLKVGAVEGLSIHA